jgi:hypothetical protein
MEATTPASATISTITKASDLINTDMPITIAWCGIRDNDPAIALTNNPTEDAAPHASAAQTPSAVVSIYQLGRLCPRWSLQAGAAMRPVDVEATVEGDSRHSGSERTGPAASRALAHAQGTRVVSEISRWMAGREFAALAAGITRPSSAVAKFTTRLASVRRLESEIATRL